MKHGVVFSLTALVIAGLVTTMLVSPASTSLSAETQKASLRVDTLHRFAGTYENYVKQSARVTAYNSLAGMIGSINATGSHYASRAAVKDDFRECMLNGTISDGANNCSWSGEKPTTLSERLEDFSTFAHDYANLNVTYNITAVTLEQTRFPFHVTVTTNHSYTVSDPFASINRTVLASQLVSIEDLKDPLYTKETDARTLVRTTIEPNRWSNDTVAAFIQNKSYRHYNQSPSFLQRMTGDATATSTCCGIEAILTDETDNITFTGDMKNASTVDYIYYQVRYGTRQMSCDNVRAVNGLGVDPSTVQIDQAHLTNLNVSPDLWHPDCTA